MNRIHNSTHYYPDGSLQAARLSHPAILIGRGRPRFRNCPGPVPIVSNFLLGLIAHKRLVKRTDTTPFITNRCGYNIYEQISIDAFQVFHIVLRIPHDELVGLGRFLFLFYKSR